ncbi:MAG: heavy metal-associated domain-containing protein [Coriobacteriaceae bacterium]|nr:heavy-metal-associated domain-containing protein [Coriobacteriaceae bacterium]MDO4890692.1 heavy metal-associated domain-containing protein [Coriobacteriaceae bacterium]
MTKTYKAEIGCADCAAKMEDAIAKLDGVEKIRVNFMTQKVKLTADDARFDSIVDEAERIARRIEPEFALAR